MGWSDFGFLGEVKKASEKIRANALNSTYKKFQFSGLIFTSPRMALQFRNFEGFLKKKKRNVWLLRNFSPSNDLIRTLVDSQSNLKSISKPLGGDSRNMRILRKFGKIVLQHFICFKYLY